MNYYERKAQAQKFIETMAQTGEWTTDDIIWSVNRKYQTGAKATIEYIKGLIERKFIVEENGILKWKGAKNVL